jgi:hypothetical protein
MFTIIVILIIAFIAYLICTSEDRARKAQAAATMQALSDIHDEMMRECGMPEMVGKFNKD